MLLNKSKNLKMPIGASNLEVIGDLSQDHSGKGPGQGEVRSGGR